MLPKRLTELNMSVYMSFDRTEICVLSILFYDSLLLLIITTTELAALNLVDRLTYEMDRGKIPLNIYIDLSKAFDTLHFEILLVKLAYYRIKGIANSLIRSYLTNRKQI